MRIFATLFLALISSFAVSYPQTDVLTVCQVLSSISHNRGEIIAVRGLVYGGKYHGFVLKDYETKGECSLVAQSGRHWPSALSLVFPRKNYSPTDEPLKFTPNFTKIEDYLAKEIKIREETQARNEYDFVNQVTFVGELRSREGIDISSYHEGTYAGNGYGQGGQYAATLMVKSVIDAKIVDMKTWKWK
jgi:hypothetical protein